MSNFIVPFKCIRLSLLRTALSAIFLLPVNCPTTLAKSPIHFDCRDDVFAFSNDTVFAYGTDERGNLTMHTRSVPAEFSHRCLVLARAVMQFHQFARFDPDAARATSGEIRRLTKKICRIPVWRTPFPPERAIVIPGYRNLREFSKANEHMLKEELGNWLPTYLRVGNWRMALAFPRFGQERAAVNLTRALDHGELQAVYLARSLTMNHCVVLYDYRRLKNGDLAFDLYDPNYPGEKGALSYSASQRTFDFPKRWFWPGGRVNLMRVYLTPWH